MNKLKNLISIVLTFFMLLSTIPLTVFAESASPVSLPAGVSFTITPSVVQDGEFGNAWNITNGAVGELNVNPESGKVYKLSYDVRVPSGGTGIITYTQNWAVPAPTPSFTWEAYGLLKYPNQDSTNEYTDFVNQYVTVEYTFDTTDNSAELLLKYTESGDLIYSGTAEGTPEAGLPRLIQIRSWSGGNVFFKNVKFEEVEIVDPAVMLPEELSFLYGTPNVITDGEDGAAWQTNGIVDIKIPAVAGKIYKFSYQVKVPNGGTQFIPNTKAYLGATPSFTWEESWELKYPGGTATGETPNFKDDYITVEYVFDTSNGSTKLNMKYANGDLVYDGGTEAVSDVVIPEFIQISSIGASTEKSVYFKNISFQKYEADMIKSATIEGDFEVGNTLTGIYDVYQGYEGLTCTYRWLLSDKIDGEYEPLEGEVEETLVVKEEYEDKFIKFEVTPTIFGIQGNAYRTNSIGKTFKPVAENVRITGESYPGKTLTGQYKYEHKRGIPEGESKYSWLISSEKSGEFVEIGSTKTLVLDNSHIGKYIKFSVTPIAQDSVAGETVTTRAIVVGAGSTDLPSGIKFTTTPTVVSDGSFGNAWHTKGLSTEVNAELNVNLQSGKSYMLKYDIRAESGGTGLTVYSNGWGASLPSFTWNPQGWLLTHGTKSEICDFVNDYVTVEYILNTSDGTTELTVTNSKGRIIYTNVTEAMESFNIPKYLQIRSFGASESKNGVFFKNLTFGETKFEPTYISVAEDKRYKVDTPIYVTFNAPVNKADITRENFVLYDASGKIENYQLETTEDGYTVVFVFENELDYNKEYSLFLSGNISTQRASVITDTNSGTMGIDYVSSFKTEYKIDSKVRLYDYDDGYITAESDVIFKDFETAEIIAVLYDGNCMKDIKTKQVTSDKREKIVFSFKKHSGLSENTVVRMFSWDSSGNMTPLGVATEINYGKKISEPMQIFVSAQSSGGDGSFENPFATIAQARDYIRSLNEYPKNGVVVNIREGVYYADETLIFDERDSGTEEAPVIYRGYLNEKPVIIGYEPLDISDFKDYDGSLSNLPSDKASYVKVLDLSKYAIDIGQIGYMGTNGENAVWSELIYNGETMMLARYPDKGTLGSSYSNFKSRQTGNSPTPFKWKIEDSLAKKISSSDDLYCYNWFAPIYIGALEKVNVKLEYTIPFLQLGAAYYLEMENFHSEHDASSITNSAIGSYSYYLVNSPAFLDSEKEYYIDKAHNKLYFYMPSDTCFEIGMTRLRSDMVKTNGADNIVFKNITFSGGIATGIVIGTDSVNIDIEGCTIRNFRGSAVVYEACDISKNSHIKNCEIFDIGGNGIMMTCGKNETLTPAAIEIYNNKIHRIGRLNMYQCCAIKAEHTASLNYYDGTPGVYIGYNEIYDVNEWAVLLGADSVMEYNDIYDVAKYSDDTGAVYWGGDMRYGAYMARGRKILNNYIHDIETEMTNPYFGTRGIYMDGCTEVEIKGNIVANTTSEPYLSTSSGLHTVENNIFVGKNESSGVACETVQIENGGNYSLTADEVKAYIPVYSYDSPLWIAKYPNVKRYLEQEDGIVHKPIHTFRNNIIYNCSPIIISADSYNCEESDISYNWEGNTDPGFVDAKNGNYQLTNNAGVLASLNGFAVTDMSLIGRLSKRTSDKLRDAVVIRNYSNLYYESGETKTTSNAAYLADDDMYVSGDVFEKFGIFSDGLVSVKEICNSNRLSYTIYDDICVIGNSKVELRDDEIRYVSDILNKY